MKKSSGFIDASLLLHPYRTSCPEHGRSCWVSQVYHESASPGKGGTLDGSSLLTLLLRILHYEITKSLSTVEGPSGTNTKCIWRTSLNGVCQLLHYKTNRLAAQVLTVKTKVSLTSSASSTTLFNQRQEGISGSSSPRNRILAINTYILELDCSNRVLVIIVALPLEWLTWAVARVSCPIWKDLALAPHELPRMTTPAPPLTSLPAPLKIALLSQYLKDRAL